MTDIVEEARALLAQATPGPWRPCPHKMFVFGPRHEMIASTSRGEPEYGVERGTVEIRGAGAGLPMDQNHDLIVAAPRLIAALADECERLRAENARLREAMPTDAEMESIAVIVGVGLRYTTGTIDEHHQDPAQEAFARLDAAKGVR